MRLQWRPLAEADLEQVAEYLIEEAGPERAADLLEAIERQIERLLEFPELGRRGRLEGTRELIVAGLPYVVPYRRVGEVIEVLRVYHAARHWPPAAV